MKLSSILMFIVIALSIYLVINYYIFRRGWVVIQSFPHHRYWILSIFLFGFLSFPIGMILDHNFRGLFSNIIGTIGGFYLAVMLYLLIFILFIDILRFGNYLFHFFPEVFATQPDKTKRITFLIVVSMIFLTIIYGFINNLFIRVNTVNLSINKKAGNIKNLNIVLLSDIHTGNLLSFYLLKHASAIISSIKPDLILFAGDIVDQKLTSEEANRLSTILTQLNPKYGKYACSGNHEYIMNIQDAVKVIENGGVHMIQDGFILVNNSFYIIGRKDSESRRFGDTRKSLKEIVKGIDKEVPMLLLDHQPLHIKEAEDNGIDLQLSGHTHNGQIFPINFIIKKIYEIGWGYAERGKTQYYTSCGLGVWGPLLRIASYPEIVNIKIAFKEE